MATEYPEKEVKVVFKRRESAWSEPEQRIIEYYQLFWNTGQITWQESSANWWEEELSEE